MSESGEINEGEGVLLYTFDSAARVTGLSSVFLRKEAARGNLRVRRFGRAVRIPAAALREYALGDEKKA